MKYFLTLSLIAAALYFVVPIALEREHRRMVITDVTNCERGYIKAMDFCTRAYAELEKITRKENR